MEELVNTLAPGDLLFSAAAGCAESAGRICVLLSMHTFPHTQEKSAVHHARNLFLLGADQLSSALRHWEEEAADVKPSPEARFVDPAPVGAEPKTRES